jgi:hypothetical protein
MLDADEREPARDHTAPGKKKAEELAAKIIHELKGGLQGGGVVHDLVRKAWELAYDLMEFSKDKMEEIKKKVMEEEEEMKKAGNAVSLSKENMSEIMSSARKDGDDKMWEVIQGVWVEMLCFSAGRCRGYLHAKSLGKGGEYLSYVWLLSYMVMETLAQKMQRTELTEQGDDSGGGGGGGGSDRTAPASQATTTTIGDGDEKAAELHDGAGRTTTTTDDEKRDYNNGGSHCTTSATPAATTITGDENV